MEMTVSARRARGVYFRDDQVWLTNAQHDGRTPIPLRQCPMIFEDFIRTIEGCGTGLLNLSESLEDSRLALLARDSADQGGVLRC